jgi:hypothetical protein
MYIISNLFKNILGELFSLRTKVWVTILTHQNWANSINLRKDYHFVHTVIFEFYES